MSTTRTSCMFPCFVLISVYFSPYLALLVLSLNLKLPFYHSPSNYMSGIFWKTGMHLPKNCMNTIFHVNKKKKKKKKNGRQRSLHGYWWCSWTPVPPLWLLKGTHHLSELHRERVYFGEFHMSLICQEKRVTFLPNCSQFGKKGPSKHRGSQRFQEKGLFLEVSTQFECSRVISTL